MARCPRCSDEHDARTRWCPSCERDFDTYSRLYATDIVWASLAGMLVVMGIGIGVPLLGASTLVALGGAFAGFGTILGMFRFVRRRRRRAYLRGAALPRAYLPGKT
jgi:hypothetical protein